MNDGLWSFAITCFLLLVVMMMIIMTKVIQSTCSPDLVRSAKNHSWRDTWVAQWLSICLWLRLWSRGPGIESHIRLPTGSLLVPLPMSLPLSLCLSWINKQNLKKKMTCVQVLAAAWVPVNALSPTTYSTSTMYFLGPSPGHWWYGNNWDTNLAPHGAYLEKESPKYVINSPQ